MKNAFLAAEFTPAPADDAAFHIIPVPMELSVSYGSGTRLGPRAILDASQQLEASDAENHPCVDRIHTQTWVRPRSQQAEFWIQAIARRVTRARRCGACPVILGGEHTVTLGAARAFHQENSTVGFIQFDAHADLRNTYEGSPLSHACVMRRIHELGFPCLQIGTRAVSREEYTYRTAHRKTVTAFDAGAIADGKMTRSFMPRGFPRQVYITFDLDGLDPAIMPATGTPVPGGLFWYDVIRMLRQIAAKRDIIGFDIVELAPLKGLSHPNFTAALLTQTLMGFAQTRPSRLE